MKSKPTKRILSVMLALVMVFSTIQPVYQYAETTSAVTDNASAYLNNQGKLTETPLIQLPLGSVKAEGWLENQLLLMKNGITGNMKTYEDYNYETSAWLNGTSGEAWENGPYFARGLIALAYTLDDEELIDESLTWVAGIIDSQQANGYFGPAADNSWWSRMPMLCVVRDFYEAVNAKPETDRTEKEQKYFEKVLPFLDAYFRYQASELPNRPLSNWADARGGDNLEIVYWYYNQVYDKANPKASDWLIDLGDLIYSQTFNWENEYNNTTVRQHIVNTSQGMKTPAVYSQYKNEEKYKVALSNGLDNFGIDHGRIDGLPNSDEAARENRSTRGAETCSTVEGLLSTEIAMKILGEAWLGDRLETLAYNALPAAYPSDYSGHAYYILQNQVLDTLGNHEFDCDHGDSSAFGAPCGFDCCYANNHMGWSKFVQNMWMATADGGLAIVAYGPNNVTAKVAGGKTAVFEQTTDYPFKDTVLLDYYGDTATFELKVRVPEWSKGTIITVNGETYSGAVSGEYYTITREWTKGDSVRIQFTREIELSTWYNNSTAVQYGALIFSLKIEEDWRIYDSNDARELKVEHKEDQPLREVYPASDWNYGLVTDGNAVFEVHEAEDVAMQPFESNSAPITITAKGVQLDEWVLDGNIAGPQPYGPISYAENEMVDITLIPYGCGRLRITHFPTMNNEADTNKVVRTESKTIKRNGKTYQDFDNIVVPKANNYTLNVTAEGSGTMTINSKYTQTVSGSFTLNNLKNLSGLSGNFQFKDGQYNNIRFEGNIKVSKVEVVVESRTIENVLVLGASRSGSTAKITTNLDAQETPYQVVYGTESGKYTNTTNGFTTGTATLLNLDADKTYYAQVIATICGVQQKSAEIVLEVAEESGGLKPNPNVPSAVYTGFNTLNYMVQDWVEYDPENKVSIQAATGGEKLSEIRIEKGPNVKAILNLAGSENWVDYVVEADITVDKMDTNNAGIIFRTTNAGEGPDNFNGYFVGIGPINGKQCILVGYGDGSWHTIEEVFDSGIELKAGQTYTLKAVVYGDQFAVYVDDQLINTYDATRFTHGTVGLRSYNEAFTTHNVTVRNITEEDLTVFEVAEEEVPSDIMYAGFGSVADTQSAWTEYDPYGKVSIRNATSGTLQSEIRIEKNDQVKAVLNTAGSANWTDYVVEAELSVDKMDTNNAGIIFRATDFGNGPDDFRGFYVGIGRVQGQLGIMVGYGNHNWNNIQEVVNSGISIQPGQKHTIKVVIYEDQFAVYVDNQFVGIYNASLFSKGTVGVRSYNEAFTTHNLTVRKIEEADLAVFEQDEEVETIIPDYKQTFDTEAWAKFGDTDLIHVSDGVLSMGTSTNVKAVGGNTEWTDMVYSADVTLGAGNGNAGLLVRSSKEGSGADNYYGYYFGITGTHYEIGKASNNWKSLESGELPLDTSVAHELKVVAYKNIFMFYVDGKYVTTITDYDHTNGRVGIRGYDRSVSIDNVVVRGLTEAEIATATNIAENGIPMEISAVSSKRTIQVKYPRIANASYYRVVYGTESGQYTNEFTEVYFNGYKGGGIFSVDKVAVNVPEDGTYYVKMYAMNGNVVVSASNEIVVTTNETASTETDQAKVAKMLATAKATDTTEFTTISKARLADAIAYAEMISAKADANQNELAVAEDLLAIAVNTPDTVYPAPEKNEALLGDVNSDGVVNAKDVAALRRYLAGGWDVTIDLDVADVNYDDAINAKDVATLRRYLAGGWDVELG